MTLAKKYAKKTTEIFANNASAGHEFALMIGEVDNVLKFHNDKENIVKRVERYVEFVLDRGVVMQRSDVKKYLKLTTVFSQSELQLALGYMLLQ